MKPERFFSKMAVTISVIALLMTVSPLNGQDNQQEKILESPGMRAVITPSGLVSVTDPGDKYNADIVSSRIPWGRMKLVYRSGDGAWIDRPDSTANEMKVTDSSVLLSPAELNGPLSVRKSFYLKGDELDFDIDLVATGGNKVEIGDLAFYLSWNIDFGEEPEPIFEKSFTKHHYISGNGSFIYFTRPSGEPPFLMVLPKKGTKLEYFDSDRAGYRVYVHSTVSGNNVKSGTWRQDHTSLFLTPGSENDKISLGFKILWADSWDDMREALYDNGLFDIRVVPGMSLPSDLPAQFALHTQNKIDSIVPEYPEKTVLKYKGEKQPGHHIYEVKFEKLGENKLTVYYGQGEKTYLEFFSTEPLETLIKKRSAFIVNSTQHKDTTKWYNGLYSAYDMKNGILRGPDNTDGYDGWWGYVLACDDPGLCKAPYVAAKNVYFPDDKEIESVEYYLKEFVWNGLQRTDTDRPYPYGVYGVPNWKVARDPVERAKIRNSNLDKMKIWRSYDYPHIVMLYYHMYQIAKMYPEKVHYLNAEGYLERAWQTARAYFIYPYEILPWYETYKWGCYNEIVIESLIADLEKEGRKTEADWLRQEYEKKVKYFVYDDKYPFRSEYAIDRTAFESSYAFAKYGSLNEMKPDTNLWWDKNDSVWYSHPVVRKEDARAFMDRQHYAGLAVRGWLETKYFLLGSDFTFSSDDHCLSYMAKMGGWSILDYGINFAEKPYDWLQLGYASYLSSWALMNTGTEESDYGYWFPGKKNDGAMGWAFMESKHGYAWIRKEIDRGAWFYDGEADLGNGAGIRIASTVVTNDPLFGWLAYGGLIRQNKKGFSVIPRDGLRDRLSIVTDNIRTTMTLNRDGFAGEKSISLSDDLNVIKFDLENRTADSHSTIVTISSGGNEKVIVTVDGKEVNVVEGDYGSREAVLPISREKHKVIVTFKR